MSDKEFTMSEADRELFRRYAVDEQDNPNFTEEDINASIAECTKAYGGSIKSAIRSMRQWYSVTPERVE